MPDYAELVEKLRDKTKVESKWNMTRDFVPDPDCQAAATAIETLVAELAEARQDKSADSMDKLLSHPREIPYPE